MGEQKQVEYYSTQTSILWQSQQKMALEFLLTKGIDIKFEELQNATELFVQCCIQKPDADLKNRIKRFDKWIHTKRQKMIEEIQTQLE